MVEIPPVGPKRDAAIAEALGWKRLDEREACSTREIQPHNFLTNWMPSTDLDSCDRLVRELARLGWVVVDLDTTRPTVHCFHGEAPIRTSQREGSTRQDAVIAAALLALSHRTTQVR